jgi:deoxyinosine 3'endonuclease (endonuclease V)
LKSTIKLIGAVDISYSKTNQRDCVAALIVVSFPEMKVLYEDYEKDSTEYPYIPGFLAFKEVPVYTILF